MELEMKDDMTVQVDRLAAAAALLEETAARLGAVQVAAESSRVAELEAKLRETESTVASLRASSRRGAALQSKDPVAETAGGVDLALASLPVEQRIAVKAQLMRSGLL